MQTRILDDELFSGDATQVRVEEGKEPRKGSKRLLGSTHVIEQLICSMFPSILTYYIDLIKGSFLIFFWP